jgi:hypothetical protein
MGSYRIFQQVQSLRVFSVSMTVSSVPFIKRGTYTTRGTRKAFEGYAAQKKLLKTVRWLALNKETKSSYRHETTSPS